MRTRTPSQRRRDVGSVWQALIAEFGRPIFEVNLSRHHDGVPEGFGAFACESIRPYIARNQEGNESGRAQVVRNGKARPRKVTLGSGTIEVQAPRVDDRRRSEDGSRQTFRSQILPPDMRRSPKVAEVLPILYLRGLFYGRLQGGPDIAPG